jgi:hypothetical protein
MNPSCSFEHVCVKFLSVSAPLRESIIPQFEGKIFSSDKIASVIFRAVRPDGFSPPVMRVAKK